MVKLVLPLRAGLMASQAEIGYLFCNVRLVLSLKASCAWNMGSRPANLIMDVASHNRVTCRSRLNNFVALAVDPELLVRSNGDINPYSLPATST